MFANGRTRELIAEARYRRQRYDLYKAKAYGPRLTSPTRLRELERAWVLAEARLRHAQTGDEDAVSEPDAIPADGRRSAR